MRVSMHKLKLNVNRNNSILCNYCYKQCQLPGNCFMNLIHVIFKNVDQRVSKFYIIYHNTVTEYVLFC